MKTLFILLFLSCSSLIYSQEMMIDTSYSVEDMIMDFFDNDSITISNIDVSGAPIGIGFFDSELETFDLNAGLVLSTGDVTKIPAPASEFITAANEGNSDDDINYVTQFFSYDASVIEFDFTITEDQTLDFSYIFGSEEYPEFVNTNFNDAFLFLVSGPNYNGAYSNNSENIATLPDTNIIVSINSINDMENSEYYFNNELGTDIAFDGYTTVLPSTFDALANQTYHIKIVIADVSDSAYDSAIFLGYNSLGNGNNLTPPAQAEFSINGNMLEVINTSKYATSYQWDFGNNTYSQERHPANVSYDTEGDYEISLITQNYCCSDTFKTTVTINSMQALMASIQTIDVPCSGGNDGAIDVAIVGGTAPYNVNFTPEIIDLNMVSAGTYVYSIVDADENEVTGEVTIIEPPLLVAETSSTDATQGQNNGTASVMVEGGVAPYTYLWSNGETDPEITDLLAGNYTVEITDANECVFTEEVTVNSVVNTFEEKVLELKVFPNPSSDFILIETDATYSIDRVEIFNQLGERFSGRDILYDNVVRVDIEFFPVGSYYISIYMDENPIPQWGKFIKE